MFSVGDRKMDILTVGLMFSIIAGILGLIVVFILRRWILNIPIEVEKTGEVAKWIKTGARAFLKREYTTIMYFIVGIAVVLGVLAYYEILAWPIMYGFIFGAILSLIMAWIGMETATDANVRTTNAGRKDAVLALKVAFRGGAVTGLSLVSLAILGISILYWITGNPSLVVGFGFGASLAALFAQLGGGIYTKSADIGADLVGKVEQRLEEDDPRNAAVIADQVGDNVGDCAGRASDLFESFSDNLISIMIIGAFIAGYSFATLGKVDIAPFVILPLVLQGIAIIATIVGVFTLVGKDPTKSIYGTFLITGIISTNNTINIPGSGITVTETSLLNGKPGRGVFTSITRARMRMLVKSETPAVNSKSPLASRIVVPVVHIAEFSYRHSTKIHSLSS